MARILQINIGGPRTLSSDRSIKSRYSITSVSVMSVCIVTNTSKKKWTPITQTGSSAFVVIYTWNIYVHPLHTKKKFVHSIVWRYTARFEMGPKFYKKNLQSSYAVTLWGTNTMYNTSGMRIQNQTPVTTLPVPISPSLDQQHDYIIIFWFA